MIGAARRVLRVPGSALLGGAVAAFVLHGLTPVAARVAGRARSRIGRDELDLLARDHRRILDGLGRLVTAGGGSARKARLFAVKRQLAAHALAEEDVVYPLLHDDDERREHVERLYAEHAEMKILLHRLEHDDPHEPSWTEDAVALRALVERHARDEEDNLFPVLQERLSAEQRHDLSGEIRREKALIL